VRDDRSTTVVEHYSHGGLLAAILRGLAATGKSTDPIDSDDLAAGDEFHVGGRVATSALFDQLAWRPGVHILDVGCGIGGPARYLARHRDACVIGVDLTPEFVEVARELARAGWLMRCTSRSAMPCTCRSRTAAWTRPACYMSG
jgi:MPBQ/MSBQ methyltransferase